MELPKIKCRKCRKMRPALSYSPNARICSPCRVKRWQKRFPEKYTLLMLSHRSRKLGDECNLDVDDLKTPEFCPVLGIRLDKNAGGQVDSAPSVDRIDNSRGYIKGNIVIVSRRANRLKSDASIEELIKIADFYSQFLDGAEK